MDLFELLLAQKLNGGSRGLGTKYKSIIYNLDRSLTFVDEDDNVYEMECDYLGDKITNIEYRGRTFELYWDGEDLIGFEDVTLDFSKATEDDTIE